MVLSRCTFHAMQFSNACSRAVIASDGVLFGVHYATKIPGILSFPTVDTYLMRRGDSVRQITSDTFLKIIEARRERATAFVYLRCLVRCARMIARTNQPEHLNILNKVNKYRNSLARFFPLFRKTSKLGQRNFMCVFFPSLWCNRNVVNYRMSRVADMKYDIISTCVTPRSVNTIRSFQRMCKTESTVQTCWIICEANVLEFFPLLQKSSSHWKSKKNERNTATRIQLKNAICLHYASFSPFT